MKAKILVYALPALILATIHLADAQQPAQVHRVGFLAGGSLARNAAFIEAFRQNLRELGYRVPRVGGKGGPFSSTRGRAGASQGSPYRSLDYTSCPGCEKCDPDNTNCIVMVGVGDPLVANLARPSANLTGLTTFSPELSGKRLELLKEVVPVSLALRFSGIQATAATCSN